MWRRAVAGVLGAWFVLLALPALAAASDDGTRVLLSLQDPQITESSGLAASVRHPGVLYTHNDSGDSPRVYAVGPDGRTRAALTLRGAKARDWEAIATGRDDAGRPALFVGDIGDNLHGAWPSISVYRMTEPATLRDATVAATRFRFRYADGARDAEALLVDPRTNRLYIVSKERDRGGLYQAPARLRTDRINVLRRVGDAPALVTDGAFAPDGSRFVLRGYLTAHAFSAPGRAPVRDLGSFGLPLQAQGESATYSRDGRFLLVGSEGTESKVWQVALPEQAAAPVPAPTGTPGAPSGPPSAASRRPADDDRGTGPRTALAVLAVAGAGALVIAAVRLARR
jgi:hypothetical protein